MFRKPSIFLTGNYIISCRCGLSIGASCVSWFVTVMEGRELRSKKSVNYRELADLQLPRARRKHHLDTSNELFPVRILEKSEHRVKVHYVGFASKYDEWKDESELESLETDEVVEEDSEDGSSVTSYFQPYSLYNNLSVKIKQVLSCGRKSSPTVRIVMPFDVIQFNGGLKVCGVPSKKVRGIQQYHIRHYRDLNPLLGRNWHFRGLNINGDYGYAIMQTVEFYLRRCKPLKEYLPPQSDEDPVFVSFVDTGYVLNFSFVCGYGTLSTFGKDKEIFYE